MVLYLIFTFLADFIDSVFLGVYTKSGLIVRLRGAPWSCYMAVCIRLLMTNLRGSPCTGLRGCQSIDRGVVFLCPLRRCADR